MNLKAILESFLKELRFASRLGLLKNRFKKKFIIVIVKMLI